MELPKYMIIRSRISVFEIILILDKPDILAGTVLRV